MAATLTALKAAFANEGFQVIGYLDEETDFPAVILDYSDGDYDEDDELVDGVDMVIVLGPAGAEPTDAMKDGVRQWYRGERTSVAGLRTQADAPDEADGVGIHALRLAHRFIPGSILTGSISSVPDYMMADEREELDPSDYPAAQVYTITLGLY